MLDVFCLKEARQMDCPFKGMAEKKFFLGGINLKKTILLQSVFSHDLYVFLIAMSPACLSIYSATPLV